MHHANHFYGHASVMARYAGLDGTPPIRGYLQHGWNMHDGFAVGTAFAPGYPKFVWSAMVRRRALLAGLRHVDVIGSPFSYLLSLRTPPTVTRAGTIVYPFHGWEGQEILGDHAEYAALVAREEDPPLTACLYWHDYQNEQLRAVYAAAGFRVITHGERGHMYRGHDAQFLDRQLTELWTHRRAVSNRMGSALLYAAATGASIGVYGDPMVLLNDHAVLGGMAKQMRLYPAMHQVDVPPAVAEDAAVSELGLDSMVSPAEVRWRFGWDLVGDRDEDFLG